VAGLRLVACLTGTVALCLLAGGTPERDIYITVALDGEPPLPDTVLALGHDVLPANIVPGQENVPALAFSLTRASQNCNGPLFLTGLRFRVECPDGSLLDPFDIIAKVKVEVDTRAIPIGVRNRSGSDSDAEGDESKVALVDIELSEPALVPAVDTLKVEILVDLGLNIENARFTMTMEKSHIDLSHERCSDPILLINDEDGPGVITGGTTIIPRTLTSSFSNYPNPFSAGRQVTTFAFYLPRRAEVSLRLYNGFGRQIAILESAASKPGGRVIEDITWDGRDDSGAVMQNGTYFAVLVVRYEDGTGEEVVRKVAVLR
jgi:hypothetical protein